MKLLMETIKGKKFEIHVGDDGRFFSVDDGSRTEADTLAGLKTKLASGMRRAAVKVEIPVVWWNNGKLKRGMFTGIHARNQNLLLREDDGKSEQISSWEGSKKYFPPEHAEQLAELSAASVAAANALEAFTDKYSFDIRYEIKKIVETCEAAPQ